MTWSFGWLLIFSALSFPAWAQFEREPDETLRQSREEAMFGQSPEPASEPTPERVQDQPSSLQQATSPQAEGQALKGSKKHALEEDQLPNQGLLAAVLPPLTTLQEDILTIGGQIFLRYQYTAQPNTDLRDNPMVLPSLYDIFLDARPSERLRIFFRGRLSYAPSSQPTGLLSNPADPIPVNTQAILDQFWLKLDVAHVAFITLGRQPIRWGSCRFWNPTDFLIRVRRDPLTLFDQRVGVDLIKLHVPIESLGWNVYAIADTGGSRDLGSTGLALRAETLFATTELTFSVAKRPQNPWKLGLDLSSDIGLLDIRWEGALLYGVEQSFYRGAFTQGVGNTFSTPQVFSRADQWLLQTAASVELTLKYSDTDTITLGAEYFYNQLGYDNIPYYLLFFQEQQRLGRSIPFLYLGTHYLGGFVTLPRPWYLDNSTIILSSLTNVSDRSSLLRLDWQERLYTYLFFNVFTSISFGGPGELHFSFDGRNFPTNNAILQQIVIEPALWQAGIALRVNI